LLLHKGLTVEAREQLEKAIQLDPKFEEAKQALSRIAAP
jgi:hypothetical protein